MLLDLKKCKAVMKSAGAVKDHRRVLLTLHAGRDASGRSYCEATDGKRVARATSNAETEKAVSEAFPAVADGWCDATDANITTGDLKVLEAAR